MVKKEKNEKNYSFLVTIECWVLKNTELWYDWKDFTNKYIKYHLALETDFKHAL